jgi:hypothetical protein
MHRATLASRSQGGRVQAIPDSEAGPQGQGVGTDARRFQAWP